MTERKSVEEFLREPYSRVVIPDVESGTFTGQVLEFPGCIAQGDTPQETYTNLDEAAKGWLRAALAMGQSVPEPFANQIFNGKVLLRLPKSLHRQATLYAEHEGVSLNQFIATAVAEKVGEAKAALQIPHVIFGQHQFPYHVVAQTQQARTGTNFSFFGESAGTVINAAIDMNKDLRTLVVKDFVANKGTSHHG